MEAVKLFDENDVPIEWECDGQADTLCFSFGLPKPATNMDVGKGVIVRYEGNAREVVGLTTISVGRRLEEHVRHSA